MRQTAFVSTEKFTQDEFEAWLAELPPSDINRYELLNGLVVMTPPAGWPHGSVESRVNRALGNFVLPRGLGEVFGSSTGYHLPSGDIVEPDVSFVSHSRLQAGPPPQRGKFLEVVPNLVVEILSDATAARDQGEKKDIYERNGVEEYWAIDPDRREVYIFSLTAGRFGPARIFGATDMLTSSVLLQFTLPVGDLFV